MVPEFSAAEVLPLRHILDVDFGHSGTGMMDDGSDLRPLQYWLNLSVSQEVRPGIRLDLLSRYRVQWRGPSESRFRLNENSVDN